MTTYSISGFAVRTNDDGVALEAFSTTTEFVMQDGASTYSFTCLPQDFPQVQEVSLDIPGLIDFRINGTSQTDLLQTADWGLFSVRNVTGQTYIILEVYDFMSYPADFEYFFSYGGRMLPVVNSVAAANAFYQSLNIFTLTGTIPGVSADTPYQLSTLPGVVVTENDLIIGTTGGDNLNAGIGMDTVQAGNGADNITLLASDGGDSVDGGSGVDFVIYDTGGLAGPVVVEADLETGFVGLMGNAASRSDLSSIEVFAISGDGVLSFRGGAAGEYVQGTAGDDTLEGGAGNDTLDARDGFNQMFGGADNDTLRGGAGNDTLDGGAGADEMDGGDGIDLVSYAASTGRVLVDLLTDGALAPYAVFYAEGAPKGDTFANIENAEGGTVSDQIRGDNGDNVLIGGNGWDRLYGRQGDDTLIGDGGGDMLYGNNGADVMTGGTTGQRDRFIYFRDSDSGVGAGNRDVITDFQPGVDRIEISRIDADTTQSFKQDFSFIGAAVFSNSASELRYEQIGGVTIVQADLNGDGAADFEIELTGTMDLVQSDFLL